MSSREHHWWPVALQSYWADHDGYIHWLSADGNNCKKKYRNRKVAKKAHGHTVLKNTVWETNFENEFSNADNKLHRIIEMVGERRTLGPKVTYFRQLASLIFRKEKALSDLCTFGRLDRTEQKLLLELLISLLIRIPSGRAWQEKFSYSHAEHDIEETGKLNMLSLVRCADRYFDSWIGGGFYFVFLNTWSLQFVAGDGAIDALSQSLRSYELRGHAFIPLTPNLGIYVCTPRRMKEEINFASLVAPTWMVAQLNEYTQTYSRDYLFFLSQKPSLTEHFRTKDHKYFEGHRNEVFEYLNAVTGYGSGYRNSRGDYIDRFPTLPSI